MSDSPCGGVLDKLFTGDCALLFFIILFLLLFVGPGCDPA
jgi:hypothetical protein